MSICKSSLEKLGKAAFNSLSPEDQQKYTAASTIVGIIGGVVTNGISKDTIADVGSMLGNVGVTLGGAAIIALANAVSPGAKATTLSEAVAILAAYIKTAIVKLIDQVKHEIANKLAILFGIDENPGILSAIMEWVYKAIVQPVFKVA